ncbi:MAG: hypothetical protein GXP63_01690, partial [DPANN group archaeon]|nr:hypothetical protein [DPANN group archaeon]
IYTYNATITDLAHNTNSTETRTITLDNVAPKISFSGGTEANDSYRSRDWIYINVSIDDVALANASFLLYNSSGGLINLTVLTGAPFEANITGLDPDMQYRYNVTAEDLAGNVNSTETRTITLDNTAPGIQYEQPTPADGTNQSATIFSINVSTAETYPDTLLFYLNGSLNSSRQGYGSLENLTFPGLSDGTYTYYAWLNDSAGNSNQTASQTIRIDTTPPSISLIGPSNDSWKGNASTTVEFIYQTDDRLLSIANCSLYLDGSLNQTNQSVEQNIDQSFIQELGEGNYSWKVGCSDQVGNSNSSIEQVVRIDTTFPNITQHARNDTNISITQYLCLNATVTDSPSGISRVWARLNPPNHIAEDVRLFNNHTTSCDQSDTDDVYSVLYRVNQVGTYNWTSTYANDSGNNVQQLIAGLEWNSTSIGTITVNMTAPALNFEINESDALLNYTYNQTCTAICDDKPQNCSEVYLYAQFNFSGATDISGSTPYLVNANDSHYCGNLTAGGASCNSTFTIRSATDAGATSWKVWCRAESSIVGSYLSTERTNISINDHPLPAFTYPTNGTWLQGQESLNASLSSDDQGISTYRFELDNTTIFDSPSILCSGQDENCTFDTLSQSQCGQESYACMLRLTTTDTDGLSNSTITTIGIDNLAPRTLLGTPTDNSWSKDAAVSFSYTPTDVNIDTCIIYHNASGSFQENSSNHSVVSGKQDTTSLTFQEGTYLWNVWCNDTLQNQGFNSSNRTFHVDLTAPTIRLVSPPNTTFLLPNVTFIYNVSEHQSNISSCSLILDGTINQTNSTITLDTPINFTVNRMVDGNHSWQVNCTDYAGNENSSEGRLIRVDGTGPATVLLSPVQGMNVSSASLLLNASIDDSGGIGPNRTQFSYRENSSASWKSVCTVGIDQNAHANCTWDISLLDDRTTYEVRAQTNDSLGNDGGFDTVQNITFDRVSPLVQASSPANNTLSRDGDVVFVYNVTDTTSAISNCSLLLDGTINSTDTSISKGVNQSFSLTAMGESDYNWSVRCTDQAGNQGNASTYNLTVSYDHEPPVITLLSPAPGEIYTSEDVIFQYQANDTIYDVASCSLIVDERINQTDSSITEGTTQYFTIANMPDGNYTWMVNCTDTSPRTANEGNSSTRNLTVMKTTTLLANVTSDKTAYEQGEDARFTIKTTNQFGGAVNTSLLLHILEGNSTMAWWNTDYPYRQPIIINNSGTEQLEAGYTLNHSFDSSRLMDLGRMQAGGQDLRVVFWNNDTNNFTELDRILTSLNSSSTHVRFRIQKNISAGTLDSEYYLYYGNSSAGSPPTNKSNVFFYFDGFSQDSRSAYNQTRSFDFQGNGEDADTTLTHDSTAGQINYSGTNSNGKSLRQVTMPIRDAIIEADQYYHDIAPGAIYSRLELAARVEGDNYYYFWASTNIFDSELGRYRDGTKTQLATVNTQFTNFDVWHHLKLITYQNSSTVFLKSFVDGSPLVSYNDSDPASRISTAGGFGLGALQLVGAWDNLTVRRYMTQPPNSDNGSEERLISTLQNTTGLDGIWNTSYETLNLSIGNYSAVSRASSKGYFDGIDGTPFRIVPDTSPPAFSNIQVIPSPVWNFKDANISISIRDRAHDISQALIEGSWAGILTNDTPTNISGSSYTFSVSKENLTSGELVTYRFFANDTLDNRNNSQTFNFTVVRSLASPGIDYPAYSISRFINRTFWLNTTVLAINGSIATCQVNATYPSLLLNLSRDDQQIGSLSNGSSSTGARYLFNSSTPGSYIINISTSCLEGDGRNLSSVRIIYDPVFSNLTEDSYAELRTITGTDYLHMASGTGNDWWLNRSSGSISLDASSPDNPWYRTTWQLIINDSLTFELSDFDWDMFRSAVDEGANQSLLQAIGRIADPALRMNMTSRIFEESKVDNLSLTLQHLGSTLIKDIKVRWLIDGFNIGSNNRTDNLTFTNASGGLESYRMDGNTSLLLGPSRFNTTGITALSFHDPEIASYGYVYWEWNISKDGVKSGFESFDLRAGMASSGFLINVTFGWGNLSGGSIAAFDPGVGIIGPDLILKTRVAITDYAASEAGNTYLDITQDMTDNDTGTTRVAAAKSGDTVKVFNILNRTDITHYDEISLLIYPTAIDADPYQLLFMAYNTDNVTVQSTLTNYTLTSSHLNRWVSINITDIAHLQDGFGYLRVRMAPNGSALGNNKKVTIAEIRFNLTDRTPPNITLHAPVQGDNLSSTSTLFNFTVTDLVDDFITCNVTLDGNVNLSSVEVANGSYYNFTRELSEGIHTWNVTCIDDGMNTAGSGTRNFTVIGQATGMTITIAQDNSSLNISWDAKAYAAEYLLYVSDNYSMFSTAPNVTLSTANYTDSSSAGVTQRYYRIGIRKGKANITSTNTLGKYQVELLTGFNLVSTPLNLSRQRLGDESLYKNPLVVSPRGSVRSIYRFNESNEAFEKVDYLDGFGWSQATGSEDFLFLNSTPGYWFETNQSANVTFLGMVPTWNHSVALAVSWSVVAWHSIQSPMLPTFGEPPTYPIEVTPSDSVSTIYTYDAWADHFNKTDHYNGWGWFPATGDGGFVRLEPTKGYYFKSIQESNWTMETYR